MGIMDFTKCGVERAGKKISGIKKSDLKGSLQKKSYIRNNS